MVTVTSRMGDSDVQPSSGCESMAMELSAFFDNELAAAEATQVKQHLEHCGACRKKLEGMQRLRDGFAHMAEHRVAPRRSVLQGLMKLLSRTN